MTENVTTVGALAAKPAEAEAEPTEEKPTEAEPAKKRTGRGKTVQPVEPAEAEQE